jgi:DNA-binding CsgD family transcriptional regulator
VTGTPADYRGLYCAFSLTLTPHEVDILQCLAEGMSYRDISKEFYLSYNTVKIHMVRIRERLGARSNEQAVFIAVRLGLVKL